MDKRKTFLASVIAIIFGSSCCWMSSLLVWIGGGAFLTSISTYLTGGKIAFIVFGLVLATGSVICYRMLYKSNL